MKKIGIRSARVTINSKVEIIPVTEKKRSILGKLTIAEIKVFVFSSLLNIEAAVFDVLTGYKIKEITYQLRVFKKLFQRNKKFF